MSAILVTKLVEVGACSGHGVLKKGLDLVHCYPEYGINVITHLQAYMTKVVQKAATPSEKHCVRPSCGQSWPLRLIRGVSAEDRCEWFACPRCGRREAISAWQMEEADGQRALPRTLLLSSYG